MSPAPLVVVVAAGLAGAALLALPARPPAPASSLPRRAVAVAPLAGVAPGHRPAVPTGRFRWPLSPQPQVLRRFAVGPQRWSPGHRGVDLAGVPGRPVTSAGAGTVTFAGVVAGRGVVAVAHAGGVRTTYEPVTAQVKAGDAVAAGAPLGLLATASHCPTTCLHWGALRGGVYLDPLSLLRPQAPPVLLPLGTGR